LGLAFDRLQGACLNMSRRTPSSEVDCMRCESDETDGHAAPPHGRIGMRTARWYRRASRWDASRFRDECPVQMLPVQEPQPIQGWKDQAGDVECWWSACLTLSDGFLRGSLGKLESCPSPLARSAEGSAPRQLSLLGKGRAITADGLGKITLAAMMGARNAAGVQSALRAICNWFILTGVRMRG